MSNHSTPEKPRQLYTGGSLRLNQLQSWEKGTDFHALAREQQEKQILIQTKTTSFRLH